jgi:hypothetical protein
MSSVGRHRSTSQVPIDEDDNLTGDLDIAGG